jgi:hypothetical protein
MDQDDKVQMIEAIHGIAGFGLLVRLLMKIYQEGYYYEWTEKEQILFSKRVNVDINEVNAFINSCIKWEVFNPKIYEKYKILTSKGIQKRFLEAAKRRNSISLIKEYLLLHSDDMKDFNQIVIVDINEVNVDINEENADIGTQRIEENRIVKNRKEDYTSKAKTVIDLYHQYLPMLPAVKKITDSRISAVKNRLVEYTMEEIETMFRMASKSDFLTGRSKDWSANFDWLMKPSNFIKVIEGNYANKEGSNGQLRRDSTKDNEPAPKWDIEHLIIRAED